MLYKACTGTISPPMYKNRLEFWEPCASFVAILYSIGPSYVVAQGGRRERLSCGAPCGAQFG